MPARRCIDRFLEVLVDGDSAARTIIATVAAFDENGICPVVVDFLRLIDAPGAEELFEVLGNLTEIVTFFNIEYGALFGCKIGMFLDDTVHGFLQAAKFVTSTSSQATRIEPVAGHK